VTQSIWGLHCPRGALGTSEKVNRGGEVVTQSVWGWRCPRGAWERVEGILGDGQPTALYSHSTRRAYISVINAQEKERE
jgi:hypothetical protein